MNTLYETDVLLSRKNLEGQKTLIVLTEIYRNLYFMDKFSCVVFTS